MAYIGKTPTVGNFVKLDALTASATASYTMQVDSVNFSPESVNHMLVSLNGVIQSPTTSYTISGATITFASTLASSDSIDFIMVYGNVLDIGTPSDATVTNAKTNFVSTSSSAGLQIKGDGTTDGTLQLNCSQNSHGIKLKSPPHSASASYTLTFPNDDGDADQVLKTNGSGVLDWTTVAGETNAPYFFATGNGAQTINNTTDTVLQHNTESLDSANGYDTSNYRYTVQSGGAGLWFLQAGGYFDGASSWGSGEQVQIAIRVNGSAKMNNHVYYGGASNNWIYRSGMDQLNVGDYIDVIIWQNSGGTINWYNNNVDNSRFGGFRVKAI